jgi:GTPase
LLNPTVTSNPLYLGKNDPVEFDLHEHFSVAGVGLVVSGVMRAGTVKSGQVLLFGPDKNNQYRPVTVRGIHVNRVPVTEAYAGQYACFAIKAKDTKRDEIERKDIRKGMVLLDTDIKICSAMKFEAEIQVLHHHTTIKSGYQGVLHCGIVRQAVKLVASSREILRTGDKASITLEFLYAPEYLKIHSTILLREGRTKILGKISKVHPLSAPPGAPGNPKVKENGAK